MRVLQERNSTVNASSPATHKERKRKSSTARQSQALQNQGDEVLDEAIPSGTRYVKSGQDSTLQQPNSGINEAAQAMHDAPSQAAPTFGMQQVIELYRNTLKLASENKITKDNTWGLGLIDHMSDLVKPSDEEQGKTNFQRASCTLDAGVKIYSYRVDSVHNSIYKTLGGLSRTAAPTHQEDAGQEGVDEAESESGPRRRRGGSDQAVYPSATLEANVENLNVKKFDLTFAVDPLFHKTSAQFDEGGAKGLLLNNLSVYHGCEIVFDSSEVPDQAISVATDVSDVQLDCSAWRGYITAALATTPTCAIAPSLPLLTALLGPRSADEDEQYATEAQALADQVPIGTGQISSHLQQEFATQSMDITADGAAGDVGMDSSFGAFDDFDDGAADGSIGEDGHADYNDGDTGDNAGWDDAASSPPGSVPTQQRGSAMQTSQLPEGLQLMLQSSAESQEECSSALSRGSMWAGASHWRYAAPAQRADPDSQADSKPAPARRRTKQKHAIDFENLPELPAGAFDLAPHKDISLKAMPAVNTLLPPDHHYKASMLRQLFLKPLSATVVRRDPRDGAGPTTPAFDFGGDHFGAEDDGDDGGFRESAGWDDTDFGNDESMDTADLLEAPRKVGKISVTYSKASKQVDVRALKETLWHSMQLAQESQDEQDVSFQDLIADVPPFSAAGRADDLSVHLCFICLLHLANEHGLAVQGTESLDRLIVSHSAL